MGSEMCIRDSSLSLSLSLSFKKGLLLFLPGFFVGAPRCLPGVSPVSPWDFPGVSPWTSPGFPRCRPRCCPGGVRKSRRCHRGDPGKSFPRVAPVRCRGRFFCSGCFAVFPHVALILMVLPCFSYKGRTWLWHHSRHIIQKQIKNASIQMSAIFAERRTTTIQVNVCMNDLPFQTSWPTRKAFLTKACE